MREADSDTKAEAGEQPEVLLYVLGHQYLGCTINHMVNPDGVNASDRYKTRLVLARSFDEMAVRIVSVLVQEYGLSQEEANGLVPDQVTPMAAVDRVDPGLYLEIAGGEMDGPLLLAADPMQPLEAATQQFVVASISDFADQLPEPSDVLPTTDGAVDAGISELYSRGDHRHPTDVSRYAATNPAGYQTAAQVNLSLMPYALTTSVPAAATTPPSAPGTAAAGTATTYARGDHVHPGGSRQGTTTNDNAAAGDIGEFISASVQPGSGIAMTTGTLMDVTSVALTPGDWDVQGHVATQVASGGHVQNMQVWTSTSSKTLPTQLAGALHQVAGVATGGVEQLILPTGRMRVSLASPATVYLSTSVVFTGTGAVAGYISARRMR